MTTRSWRYRILRALPLGLFACAGSIAATTASYASTWTVTQVDNSADVGKFASLAVDANKKLHVSYYDATGKLKYATNKSGNWATPTTVVGSGVVAAGTALAIDAATGYPQINFYYNGSTSNRGMRNVAYGASGWGSPAIINGSYAPGTNQGTSIYNKGGTSYSLFVKNAGSLASLVYTKNNTAGNYSSWSGPVTVDNSGVAGTYNSIVADSTGHLHAVGYNSTSAALFYFTNASGSWVGSPLTSTATDVGKYCSLEIDRNDNLHLAYLETTSTAGSYVIKYRFKPAGGAWQDAVDVGDAGAYGGYTSIAVDSTGTPHISYYYSASSGTGNLRYATNLSGSFISEDIDKSTTNVGRYTSIGVDSDETVYIAYYDVINTALKVATVKAVNGSIAFGAVDRGFQSAGTMITVTNDQQSPVTMGAAMKSGLNAEEFAIDGDACSNTVLAPLQSCTVVMHFGPTAATPRSSVRSATLSIPWTAPYPAVIYSLSGSTTANFLITASATNGGAISPTKAAVAPAASKSFSVTTDAGFSVGSVVADGSTPLTAPYTLSNVSADHTVVATLVSPIRILESSIFYGSLQSAFATVNPGWTIQSQTRIPAGDLLIDRDVAVTLSGGYDNGFSSQSGLTSVPGNIIISNGSLTVENVLIQ